MVDVIKEAEAAERMMSDIASRQEQKAQKHAEEVREVARAEAHAAEVAAGVAAGKVADAHVGEPATSEPAFDPTQEARAAERMVASLEADKEAKAARHAQEGTVHEAAQGDRHKNQQQTCAANRYESQLAECERPRCQNEHDEA